MDNLIAAILLEMQPGAKALGYVLDEELARLVALEVTGENMTHNERAIAEDFLYNYFFEDMPYGTKKGRTGDPCEFWGEAMSQMFEAELAAI
jgi:hypothetical protein